MTQRRALGLRLKRVVDVDGQYHIEGQVVLALLSVNHLQLVAGAQTLIDDTGVLDPKLNELALPVVGFDEQFLAIQAGNLVFNQRLGLGLN